VAIIKNFVMKTNDCFLNVVVVVGNGSGGSSGGGGGGGGGRMGNGSHLMEILPFFRASKLLKCSNGCPNFSPSHRFLWSCFQVSHRTYCSYTVP
jgi:hypothetical protein